MLWHVNDETSEIQRLSTHWPELILTTFRLNSHLLVPTHSLGRRSASVCLRGINTFMCSQTRTVCSQLADTGDVMVALTMWFLYLRCWSVFADSISLCIGHSSFFNRSTKRSYLKMLFWFVGPFLFNTQRHCFHWSVRKSSLVNVQRVEDCHSYNSSMF